MTNPKSKIQNPNSPDLRIDQWVAAQLAWVRCFSLAEARFWTEHRRAIVRWHLRLLQAGFDVPLFLVIDLSFLIQHPARPLRSERPDTPTADLPDDDLDAFHQAYRRALRRVQQVLRQPGFPRIPFNRAEEMAVEAMPHLLVTFVCLLEWEDLAAPLPGRWEPDFAALAGHYDTQMNAPDTMPHPAFFEGYARRFQAFFEAVGEAQAKPAPAAVDAAALQAATWRRAVESQWLQQHRAGADYSHRLDDQFITKYLAQEPLPLANELLQHLDVVSNKQAVLHARSRRYTAFDEITRYDPAIAPSELIYLADPRTERYFWSKWAEGSLSTLGTRTQEEEPEEVEVNFCIPEAPEMVLYALAEDDQPFLSYAKYLTLLVWHDFLYLYVASGSSEVNDFVFHLLINEPEPATGAWTERTYHLDIDPDLVDRAQRYMVQMPWREVTRAGEDAAPLDLFYRPRLAAYTNPRLTDADNLAPAKESPARPDGYWTLFVPENYVWEAQTSAHDRALEIEEGRLAAWLRKNQRAYQHVLVIGFGTLALYAVQYGRPIRLRRIGKSQPDRAAQEREIRAYLVHHFLNHVLLP